VAARAALSKGEARVLLAVGLGTLLTSFDASAIATALPIIQVTFQTAASAASCVVLAELAVASGFLLCFGRLGDRVGHRPVYLAGLVVFLAAALACAAARGMIWLAVIRAVQGIGGAMVLSNSPAILVKHLPASRRGQTLGLRGSFIYLGLFLGSASGSWLAQQHGWSVIFLLQVPLGLFAWRLAWLWIPPDPHRVVCSRSDVAGSLTWVLAVATLVFGLNRGRVWGWSSLPVVVPLLASTILFAIFVLVERYQDGGLLDLSLFASRSFSSASASLVLSFVSSQMLALLLPFYLIQERRLPAVRAGLLLAAQPLTRALVAPFGGTWCDRVGPRWPAVLGLAICASGLLVLSGLDPRSGMDRIAAAILLSGIGIGIFVSSNNSLLMSSVPRSRQGVAAAVLATSRNTGMALGAALASTLVSGGHAAGRASDGALTAGLKTGFSLAAAITILAAAISATPFCKPIELIRRATRGFFPGTPGRVFMSVLTVLAARPGGEIEGSEEACRRRGQDSLQ
jgi:EmrB/QacA subfamily drug resistance transporter